MKGLIRRVAVLALVLVMTVQPVLAAGEIDFGSLCPCLGSLWRAVGWGGGLQCQPR